jgi:hypothetical protein
LALRNIANSLKRYARAFLKFAKVIMNIGIKRGTLDVVYL